MQKCFPGFRVMNLFARGFDIRLCLLVMLAVCVVGCGSAVEDKRDPNLGVLSHFYSRFLMSQRGRPPASKEDLVNYINNEGQRLLESRNIDDVESLFISTRDEQPYVIRYGRAGEPKYSGGLVICERVGVEGKRFVGYSDGTVTELAEDEIRELGFKEAFAE